MLEFSNKRDDYYIIAIITMMIKIILINNNIKFVQKFNDDKDEREYFDFHHRKQLGMKRRMM